MYFSDVSFMPKKILSFTGSSGTGKSTLAKALGFPFVLSTTTRASRPSDNPGEYEYVTNDYFDEMKRCKGFIWSIPFGGSWYGTKYQPVNHALMSQDYSLMILVPEVVPKLLHYAGTDAVLPFYIRSPLEEVLRSRLEKRGESSETIERRLQESKRWDSETESSEIPYVFITNNGTIEGAVEQVRKYLKQNL